MASKFWKNLGQGFGNYGKAAADTVLTAYGADNVIQDSAYKGNSADFFRTAANIGGGTTKAALPIVANMALPGAGTAISGAQQVGMGMNPEDEALLAQQNIPQYGTPMYQEPMSYGLNPAYMAMGGKMPKYNYGGGLPNAEVENNEVARMNDGTTEQFSGDTHENGGIPANLAPGTQIFSARLKASSGKSFAKEAEKYDTSKYKKVLEDMKADSLKKKTAQLLFDKNNQKLTELFNEQESQKAYDLNQGIYAFGGSVKDKNGNIHIKAEDERKISKWGKEHGMDTKSAAQAILAVKFGKGGTVLNNPQQAKKYWGGGTSGDEQYIQYDTQGNAVTADQLYGGQPTSTTGTGFSFGAPVANIPGTNMSSSSPNSLANLAGSLYGSNAGNGINPNVKKGLMESAVWGANNAGNLAYLKNEGKNYDKQEFYDFKPTYLDPTAALRDVDQSTYANRKMIPSVTGGNSGLALQSLLANKLQGDTTKARVRQGYQDQNAGIANQAGQYNIQNRYMVDDRNQANKDVSKTAYYQALNSLGTNTARQASAFGREAKANQYDKASADMIPQIYQFYKQNPEQFKKLMAGFELGE